jgi:hypothetical protein
VVVAILVPSRVARWSALAAALSIGCNPESPADGGTGDSGADVDTGAEQDCDGNGDIEVNTLMMVGQGGYGEACGETDPLNDLRGGACHHEVQPGGIHLDSVAEPEDVVANETTYFSAAMAKDGNITYLLLGNSDGRCGVWGSDTSYFAGLGCVEM